MKEASRPFVCPMESQHQSQEALQPQLFAALVDDQMQLCNHAAAMQAKAPCIHKGWRVCQVSNQTDLQIMPKGCELFTMNLMQRKNVYPVQVSTQGLVTELQNRGETESPRMSTLCQKNVSSLGRA